MRALELLCRTDFEKCVHKSAVTERHIRMLLRKLVPNIDAARPQKDELAFYLMTHMTRMPCSDYLRFHFLTPNVHEAPGWGKVQFIIKPLMGGYVYSEAVARFCLRYVTEYALRAEALLPPVQTAQQSRMEQLTMRR